MNDKCVLRTPRKNEKIKKSEKLFNHYLEIGDYDNASKIVFITVLKEFGVDGIINTLDDANSFIKRKKKRRGL